MITDERNEFCDAVALNTGAAGEYLLGDVIDLQVVRNIGQGQPVYVVITVDTSVTFGTATGVRFKVASDSLAAIATDGTATEHAITHDFVAADLVAGEVIVIPLPAGIPNFEQFVGILQESIGGNVSAGAINAFLTLDPHGWVSYPDAQN